MHIAKVGMMSQDHKEQLPMFVTNLGHYPIGPGIPWLRLHDVAAWFASNQGTYGSQYGTTHCHDVPVTLQGVWEESPEPVYSPGGIFQPQIHPQRPFQGNIVMLNGPSFFRTVKKGKLMVFKASVYEINKAIEAKDLKERPLEEIIPKQYHEFLPLFNNVLADHLPPHRPGIDHKVRLKEGETPSWGPLYSMSRAELVTLKEWLEENISKGFIHQSSLPFAAPVLCVNKPYGGLQFCIDHQDINSKRIQNWCPLPVIWETFNLHWGAKIYTKHDVRGAYNVLRVKVEDEHMFDFRTGYGLFEPMVMQFGTMNAPADFQGYINNTIREALDDFASAYLDDILIHSNSEDEHVQHVKWIMQRLLEAGWYLKPKKCEFHKKTVRYLGLRILTKCISMDEDTVKTVRNQSWERKTQNGRLNSLFEVQQFLGFCNHHWLFISKYSENAVLSTNLTLKDEPFVWEAEQQLAFEGMVTAFTMAPVLRHFDHEREVNIETDASDYVSAGVLSQCDDDGVLHPVAYFLKKLTSAECNYDIYDKELMAIIKALEEWRPECEGAAYPLPLITDHKNLEYFTTKNLFNRRQAWWLEFLTSFDY